MTLEEKSHYFIKLMDSPDEFTGPVNLGNDEEISILELAEKIIKLTGSASPIVFAPAIADDPSRRRPDISLAKKTLNWFPATGLEEGLKKTTSYFKKLLQK